MSATSQSRQYTWRLPSCLRSKRLTAPKLSHHFMIPSWRLRRSRSMRKAASSAFASPSGNGSELRQVTTSFFLRLRSLRRDRAERKGMLFEGGDSGRKNDAVGTSGDGSGSVGFGGEDSASSKKSSASGRKDVGVNVGDAGQNGSRVISGCESAGVDIIEAEDAVDIVDVDAESESGGGG